MKTLFLECSMGAAGDMLTAALLELTEDKQAFVNQMNAIGLSGVRVATESCVKCGITGTRMRVTVNGEEEESLDAYDYSHDHPSHNHNHASSHHSHHGQDHEHSHHSHASIADIERMIDSLTVSDQVKADAKAVYALIADAESRVHGHPISEIHFHEVGTMDAVSDVVAVCLLMEKIAPEQVIASPIHVGHGYVHCMHGILPVPAPATALILTGIPIYGGRIEGELCTPTGAALLRHFVNRFGDRPVMKTTAVGIGMGKKDFEQATCGRAFLGESEGNRQDIVKLECNLDDMTGEDVGFAMEQLFRAGAKDVYTQTIGMKKSRPGVLLSVICLPEDAEAVTIVMMKHTTTLGIRRQDMSRYVLQRSEEIVHTDYGNIRIKHASGMGVERIKAEYEDLAALARGQDVSLETIRREINL